MIEEIDAFGRDAMPGYDDLVKVHVASEHAAVCTAVPTRIDYIS